MKPFKIAAGAAVALVAFLFFTAFFAMARLIDAPTAKTFVKALPGMLLIKLLLSVCCGLLAVMLGNQRTLDIEQTIVGHGQHGSARWATEKEKYAMYTLVKQGRETKPGFVIGRQGAAWLVDTSDQNLLLLAPPGGGKTKCVYLPTIYYNAYINRNHPGKGASILCSDIKGEELTKTANLLKDCGYKVLYLDFRNPLHSYRFNLMYNINLHMDCYKTADAESERILGYARAERYAKTLSECIVGNVEHSTQSDSGNYFTETAKGLLTGIILLVSEYGGENERHIISVFRLIIELNGLAEGDSDNSVQKSRLEALLEHIDNSRIINYVGAAIGADARTSMNVFSSALSKLVAFIDAELEQMVCDHSPDLNDVDFIAQPTAIFLVCPDENTTRHFFASLFIRYLMNDLIEQARMYPNELLPRQVLCLWDEFGNMPPIKDVDTLFTAARSRGIRFITALQSLAQLEKHYRKQAAKIINDALQITMFTYMSPSSRETAEELSKTLGEKTVLSGSTSRSASPFRADNASQSYQMIGRRLMTADEIISIKRGEFVVNKGGGRALQTKLPLYFEYLPKYPDFSVNGHEESMQKIAFLTAEKIQKLAYRKNTGFHRGMFD